ncbi:MAG: proton-conducting transporter membrane subunit [Acidimicrobiia bacterium]
MSTLTAVIPLVPLVVAAIIAAAGWRAVTAWLCPVASLVVIGAGVALAVHVLDDGAVSALGGLARADALSAFMVIVIGIVALIATTYGVAYIRTELDQGVTTTLRARLYGALMQVFVAAMLVAVLADNLGVMWVAVETTTVVTAALVGHRRTRASLEAAWKYLVLGSVGVALALMGTVLVYFVSRHAGGDAEHALEWTSLVALAPKLDPGALRLAIGLVVLGYGTKAGLAPMHSWLPDAYSQAPAPVAALMSGSLSAIAFYALLRFKVVADIALGEGYVRGLLIAAALLSLAVAASLMLTQRDVNRLIAYSSIEHMGLIALGAAIGTPLAIAAALLHILGNGLAKSVMFCTSGELLFGERTTEIARVRGVLARRPLIGGVAGLSFAALIGMPPFSLFASELALARTGIADGLGWAIAIAFLLMLVIAAAILVHVLRMLSGDAPAESAPAESAPHRTSVIAASPLIVGLLAAALLGVSIWPIERLLHAAAAVLVQQ